MFVTTITTPSRPPRRSERNAARTRFCAPRYARFLQPDPIGYGDSMNLYPFAGADPVNRRDPYGTCTVVNYGWYRPSGEYLGPAGSEFFGCEKAFGDSGGWGPTTYFGGMSGSGGGADVDGSAPEEGKKRCVGEKYARFFEGNQLPTSLIAIERRTDPILLLGLSAFESGWGTSRQATMQNNPFGATPRGDATSGLSYPSLAAAWRNWNVQWGPRIQGIGSDAQSFVNRLLQDNRNSTTGVDRRGAYNSEERRWRGDVLRTIQSVRNRFGTWMGSQC
jgi:hypothetical protein